MAASRQTAFARLELQPFINPMSTNNPICTSRQVARVIKVGEIIVGIHKLYLNLSRCASYVSGYLPRVGRLTFVESRFAIGKQVGSAVLLDARDFKTRARK